MLSNAGLPGKLNSAGHRRQKTLQKNVNVENLKSQMRKGMLEFCILLLLRQGDAYASQIIEKLKQARLIVVEGTLYPLLTRLKNDGALTYRWEESPSGPPRKYYSLTDEGRENLAVLSTVWGDLAATVALLSDPSGAEEPAAEENAQ